MTYRPKSNSKKESVFSVTLAILAVVLFFLSGVVERFVGIYQITSLVFAVVSIQFYLKYVASDYIYEITDDAFKVYKVTGKKVKNGTFDSAKAPQVTIKMKGNYSGSKTIYFKIEQADISGVGFVTGDLTVTYNGKKQTPQPTLTWNGKKLKYGTDFYVPEYDNAKNDKC